MKAMRAHKFGRPEELRFEDVREPQVQAGQVKTSVRAARINPVDLERLAGRCPGLPLLYILGTDVCGEVEEASAGVSLKEGDRVFGRAHQGGYAEKTCTPRARRSHCP
jgi:NADPH2:quinone reductase